MRPTISGRRSQSRSTNSSSTREQHQRHDQAQIVPRPIFSAAAPSGSTSPRVSRAKVFSSRSRASDPATRSTVTNISVIAIADGDRERVERRHVARDHLLLDRDRLGDRGEQRPREAEVLAAPARRTGSPGRPPGARGRQIAADRAQDLLCPLAGRGPRTLAEDRHAELAALREDVEVGEQLSQIRSERIRFASVEQ